MNRSEKASWLIRELKKENPGYAVIQEPADDTEKRRLLRSLMNVRWPGEADSAFLQVQDELLREELEEKGHCERGGPACDPAGVPLYSYQK